MTFFDEIIEYAAKSETPREFLSWIPIATASVIAKNKTWIDKQLYGVYPNLYILITGQPGMIKSYPPNLTRKLANLIQNTRLISGRFSIQALIKEMASPFEREGFDPITDACAAILSGEFSASIVDDPASMTILTDLYDTGYNDKWVNSLKSTGREELISPCPVIVGAINEAHFQDMMTAREIRGGFIARCILIYGKEIGPKNSLLRPLVGFNPDLTRFKEHLLKIASLRGAARLEEEAIKEYEEWYDYFDASKVIDKTGGINRLKDKIHKVAMCISHAKRADNILTREDYKYAKSLCFESQIQVEKLTKGVGISVDSGKMRLVIQELMQTNGEPISRSKILERLTGDIDWIDFDKIITTLIQAGSVENIINGTTYTYRFKKEVMEALEKRLGGLK